VVWHVLTSVTGCFLPTLMDEWVRGRSGGLSQFGQTGEAIGVQQRLELPFVRMRLESIQPPKPFQSEYSASLPSCWLGLRKRPRPPHSEEGSRERCSGVTPPVQGVCSSSFIPLLVGWVSIGCD
jgi:hypothetical protein